MSATMDKLAKELKKQISASDDRKPKAYDTQAEVLRVEDGTAWVHIPGGVTETPVRMTINAKKGDMVNVHIADGTAWITGNGTNPPTDDSTANYAIDISNTVKKDVTILNTIVTDEIEATHARFGDVEADTAKIHDLTADQLTATVGYIDDLTAANISASDISADHATVGELDATYATIENLNATNANVQSLQTNKADISDLNAATARIGTLEADHVSTTDLVASNARIGSLEADHVTTAQFNAVNGEITNLKSSKADISVLEANYATLDELHSDYAEIDLANVNNAWIENGVIKDAAISDAQIIGVSANKLTAGTIDASNITVTNLNADNITTGTINGQRIGSESITLDKLAEEVPTKEYLDNVANNLQGQIDGQIETWTGTVVPTLNNTPASAWTTADDRHKHVGDIYYVVNAGNTADGYTYRFTESGTTTKTYSWTLIKDNQITKALQDILDMQGNISDIQTFDSQISSWKTNTDDELSSLKTRTSTLETNMGKKVDTTTFNEVSQKVDENSANITSLSSVVDTKADGSTVTTLSNTVNTVSQKADSNSSKISNITTTFGTNADGTSKADDIVHRTSAVEQDLSRFKTTVSETYQTKSDMSDYSTTTDMNSAIEQKAGKISLSVAQTEISKIEIGGKNLLRGTSTLTITSSESDWQHGQFYKSSSGGTLENITLPDTPIPSVSKGIKATITTANTIIGFAQSAVPIRKQELTQSVWVKGNSGDIVRIHPIYKYVSGGSDNENGYKEFTIEDSDWHKYTFTKTPKYEHLSGINGGYVQVRSATVGNVLYICADKMEYGNKATDWTPAPEDVEAYTDTQVSAAKAEIKVTTDGISTEVSKKVGSSEIISKINQSAETVQIDASKVEIDGAAIFNNRDFQTALAAEDFVTSSDIPTKVSDLTNDSEYQTASQVSSTIDANKMLWYAECSSAADATAKVATISPATTAFNLEVGTMINVKFDVANTAAVANLTLNVNNTGAKPIKNYYNGSISNLSAVDYLKNLITFRYDGTNWIADLTVNSTYNLGNNQFYNTIKARSAIAKDTIIVGDASGYAQAAAGVQFDLGYRILWITTALAANGTNYNALYTSVYDKNLSNTKRGFSGTANSTVYLVGTILGNTVTIDSTVITTTVPTSADGKIYIPIGKLGNQSSGANAFFFNADMTPSIYMYTNGAFQPINPTTVIEEQYIYISKASGTSSVSANTTWVTETGDKQNTWTIKRPTYNSSYPVLFVAKQTKRALHSGDNCSCTTPVKDDTTTVIDGGHITTGTIDASKATITNINASNITTGNLAADRIKTNVVSAINATLNKIDAKNINAGQITVGSLQDGSLYSTTNDMNTAIGNAVDAVEVGGRNYAKTNEEYNNPLTEVGLTATVIGPSTILLNGTATEARMLFNKRSTAFGGLTLKAGTYNLWFTNTSGSNLYFRVGKGTGATHVYSTPGEYTKDSPLTITVSSEDIYYVAVAVANGATFTDFQTSIMFEKGSKTTDWSPAPEDVQDEISGDGRNLLRTAASRERPTEYHAYTIPTTIPFTDFKVGDKITVQLWDVVADSNSTGVRVFWGGGTIPLHTSRKPDANGYLSFTYTVTQAHLDDSTASNSFIRIYNVLSGHSGMNLTVGKWKLERGTRATDWTPSPEDTDAMIASSDTNMLLDWDAASLSKVKSVANRDISDPGKTSSQIFFEVSDPPERSITHGIRISLTTASSTAVQTALTFYKGNDATALPYTAGNTYTLSCWARCTSGSGRVKLYYRENTSAVAITNATELGTTWKRIYAVFTPSVVNCGKVYFYANFNANTTGVVEMCGFKCVANADSTEASNYITSIGSDGIRIHAKDNSSTNYTQIDANGMDIRRAGTSLAAFTADGIRVGKDSEKHIEVKSDQFSVYDDDGSKQFSISTEDSVKTITRGRYTKVGGTSSTATRIYLRGSISDNKVYFGVANSTTPTDFSSYIENPPTDGTSKLVTVDGVKCYAKYLKDDILNVIWTNTTTVTKNVACRITETYRETYIKAGDTSLNSQGIVPGIIDTTGTAVFDGYTYIHTYGHIATLRLVVYNTSSVINGGIIYRGTLVEYLPCIPVVLIGYQGSDKMFVGGLDGAGNITVQNRTGSSIRINSSSPIYLTATYIFQ